MEYFFVKYYDTYFFSKNELSTIQSLIFIPLKILAIFTSNHIIAKLFLTGTRLIAPFTKVRKWTCPAAVQPVVPDCTIFNTSYKINTLYKVYVYFLKYERSLIQMSSN